MWNTSLNELLECQGIWGLLLMPNIIIARKTLKYCSKIMIIVVKMMTSWKGEKDVKSLAQKVWRHAAGQRPMNIFVHYPVGKKRCVDRLIIQKVLVYHEIIYLTIHQNFYFLSHFPHDKRYTKIPMYHNSLLMLNIT